ncbi:MAG TPA: type I secretion protein, partial [Cyanobacteria bacterium UBA11148]|nr:type I secretion protein [Cyanobacteria bacterium UBA11148]
LTGTAYSGYGNSLNNIINGNNYNNYLSGGDGNDTLVGGFGNDILTGGTDADKFVFNSRNEGIDTITDFISQQGDKLLVSASGFGGGLSLGALSSSQFTIGAAASDASDRFIYNSFTGGLFFDSDGTGTSSQVQFAKLSTGLNLIASDFVVV